MTAYKPGDILLIPFPFTNLATFKQRPCLVVSSAKFNLTHDDIIVAAITSHIPDRVDATEYLLNEAEQKAGNLPKISLIKLGKIVTLDQRLIRKRIGRLPKQSMIQVIKGIHKLFG